MLIPPKVSAAKNQEHVIHGESASLRCLADGIPAPEIFWYKDGALITAESKDFDIRQNGEELFMHFAAKSNSGTYKCAAVSGIGEDEAYITLNVFKQTELSTDQTNHVVNMHDNVQLHCNAQGNIHILIHVFETYPACERLIFI